VLVEGERWPNSIHVIEHPDGRILVDTGMIDSTPELDEQWGIRFDPDKIPRDVVCVVNTHLHFDHCGGNRLFGGTPIHVQRVEREAAREPGYTIPEWVEFDGATYVEHDGEAEIAPGVRVLPTPATRRAPVGARRHGRRARRPRGDVGYTWKLFDASESGQLLMSLRPRRIWLAHQADPRDLR
jgi:N-acyl homoserine lactone hydrolase